MFVSNAGSGATPYPLFRQAVDAGDLGRALQLARTLPPRSIVVPGVALREAVALTRHIGDQREDLYDAAAGRLLALILLAARTMALEDAQQLLAALLALPDRPDSALQVIVPICESYGISME